jgi:hypothetical protein
MHSSTSPKHTDPYQPPRKQQRLPLRLLQILPHQLPGSKQRALVVAEVGAQSAASVGARDEAV